MWSRSLTRAAAPLARRWARPSTRSAGSLATDQLNSALAAVQEEIARARFAGSTGDPDDILDLEAQAGELRSSLAAVQFELIDTNNDGQIQRDEWIARFGDDRVFDEWDLNKDGVIDPEEFVKFKAAEALAQFEKSNLLAGEQLEQAISAIQEEMAQHRLNPTESLDLNLADLESKAQQLRTDLSSLDTK